MPVVNEDVRSLATIEKIAAVNPIEGADAIEQVTVRGWNVVTKKDEFAVGDMVVYFEEDSALPLDDERFAFLAPRGTKSDGGRLYHVLKIARLRGVYSQGLVLPLSQFMDEVFDNFPGSESGHMPVAGTDFTFPLRIGKWEAPIPTGNGDTAGAFLTSYARKTDSERVQNLVNSWDAIRNTEWVATEKVDGSSMTVVRDADGNLRVMSRNLEVREGDNTYWNVVKRHNALFDPLEPGEGIQCEVAGPGIQGNRLGLTDVRPFVFTVVKDAKSVPRSEWSEVQQSFAVPVLDFTLPETPDELVKQVDGLKSVVTPGRLTEGVVFHTKDGSVVPEVGGRDTFKVISQKFLMKG